MPPHTLELTGDPPTASSAERVERLFARHHRDVYRWALRYTAGDGALAEDVVQEVFIALLGHVDRLADDDDLARWLYRVTANRCLSILRRRQVRQAFLRALRLAPPPRTELEPRLAARETLARVFETMNALPPTERVAFTMLHVDGLRQTDIANALGFSKGYVSKLIQRATDRIRALGYEVDQDGE